MGDKSKIHWTEATWNPMTGCTKISAGCKNCYAKTMAKRLKAMGQHRYRNEFEVTCHDEDEQLMTQPIRWKKPRQIFVCSMGDLFHEDVPIDFIRKVYKVMADSPRHIFQVLTKRDKRMRNVVNKMVEEFDQDFGHVYHGVTVENIDTIGRIDVLREVESVTRFVSFEPLIELKIPLRPNLKDIDWVIIGGESGAGARPIDTRKVANIISCARLDGSAVFVKQMGTAWAKKNDSESLKGDRMDAWPEWARIRETI